jgi:hypothetical protein
MLGALLGRLEGLSPVAVLHLLIAQFLQAALQL